jgi:hypothetical protein
MQEPKHGQTKPTDEVGDEGGGPGDIELEQRLVVVTGSEATTTVDETIEIVEHRRGDAGKRHDG